MKQGWTDLSNRGWTSGEGCATDNGLDRSKTSLILFIDNQPDRVVLPDPEQTPDDHSTIIV